METQATTQTDSDHAPRSIGLIFVLPIVIIAIGSVASQNTAHDRVSPIAFSIGIAGVWHMLLPTLGIALLFTLAVIGARITSLLQQVLAELRHPTAPPR